MPHPLRILSLLCVFTYYVVIDYIGHCNLQALRAHHFAFDAMDGTFVACPCTSSNSIIYIPEQHLAYVTVAVFATVNHHAKATIYNFAPAYAASVVDRNPGGAAERIAYDILDGHVGRKLRTVIDVGGLTERRICAGNIMVVATEHDRSGNFAVSHSLVEGQCNLRPAFTVRIENSCLGTYHEMVLAGLLYPVYIVTELALDLWSLHVPVQTS